MDSIQLRELARLAELPEKNPGPVVRVTRDATIDMANAAARRFLGREDIIGQSWVDLCPGMTRQLWEDVLASSPADTPVTHESEIEGPMCIHFTHVPSDAGDVVFVYGADITARRQQEKITAEQAKQLAEIARFPEMNPGPVLRTSSGATLLLANRAARQVFGTELLGQRWLDLCPGMDEHEWAAVLETPETVYHETQIEKRSYVFAHRFDRHTELVFIFGADVTRQKQAERALAQSERMATLGTLAAGVAHELNNPAAATRRAAEQLRETFTALTRAREQLVAMTPAALASMSELDREARARATTPAGLGPLERADREAEVEGWLDDHGVEDAWDLGPGVVAHGLGPADLDRLEATLGESVLPSVLTWAVHNFRVHMLSHEIGQGAARISEIVGALKSYSYLGQAPVQAVDVHSGLDSTLVILRNKLKAGIEVVRDYDTTLPPVSAHGSELNQVWTNLLDNAADAIYAQEQPHGRITIRTRREDDHAVVELEDDGPGIPEDVQPRLFDPFFTTKEPGKGTGLGLSTTYSIVTERHHGTIRVTSRPRRTVFTVRLPLDTARST